MLVEEQKLEAVIKLPSGVFKPYAGVSTAILIFTKTNAGGTEKVWFYEISAEGFSLDDKRLPISENDIPDLLSRWADRNQGEAKRTRLDKSFFVSKDEISTNLFDLSMNRYKDEPKDESSHRLTKDILSEVQKLDREIANALRNIEGII